MWLVSSWRAHGTSKWKSKIKLLFEMWVKCFCLLNALGWHVERSHTLVVVVTQWSFTDLPLVFVTRVWALEPLLSPRQFLVVIGKHPVYRNALTYQITACMGTAQMSISGFMKTNTLWFVVKRWASRLLTIKIDNIFKNRYCFFFSIVLSNQTQTFNEQEMLHFSLCLQRILPYYIRELPGYQ